MRRSADKTWGTARSDHAGVRRLQGEEGNATAVRAFEDDRLIINMSVWTSIDSLRDYVYRSGHTEPLELLRRDGPTAAAFTFKESFPAPQSAPSPDRIGEPTAR